MVSTLPKLVERVPKITNKNMKLTTKEKNTIISALQKQQDQVVANLSNDLFKAVKKISDEKARKLRMDCILDTANIIEKVNKL